MRFFQAVLTVLFLLPVTGCQTARNILFDSLFSEDEDTASEKEWKQYWRDNPSVNPRMTEAYKNG